MAQPLLRNILLLLFEFCNLFLRQSCPPVQFWEIAHTFRLRILRALLLVHVRLMVSIGVLPLLLHFSSFCYLHWLLRLRLLRHWLLLLSLLSGR